MSPEKKPKMFMAQPSASSITVEGTEIRKYSAQLVKASLLGYERACLTSLVQTA